MDLKIDPIEGYDDLELNKSMNLQPEVEDGILPEEPVGYELILLTSVFFIPFGIDYQSIILKIYFL